MRRLLAIIFVVTLLLTSYIIPLTSVYATEVTWGDNNTSTMTSTQYELFEKVAVMSMIPDLLSSGINELSIENASDVDDFVDNIIDYINTHAEDFTNLNTWSVLNDLNQAIRNKTIDIGNNMLANGTVTQEYNGTLSSFFEPQNNNTTNYKNEYKANPNFVGILNRLSKIDIENPAPSPDPDFSFLSEINKVYMGDYDLVTQWNILPWMLYNKPDRELTINPSLITFYTDGYMKHAPNNTNQYYYDRMMFYNGILNIYYDSDTNTCRYVGNGWAPNIMVGETGYCLSNFRLAYYQSNQVYFANDVVVPNAMYVDLQNSFAGLSTAINYFFQHFGNINLYVDNEPWALVGDVQNTISIDINGIDLYGGTDKPITYYYPNGTQIDYQKLYEVIKHAIQNNSPISNQTIWEGDTYYYNNNNYSPTIYNYYSEDDEDENDVINDLLTLAIVPEFDTALLEPIETPILNGEKIMFIGIQAFPNEILFVIGGGFVLVLFGAMINRLIE